MRRRIKNIIKRMLDGQDFYTNFNPRISHSEIRELENLGFVLQIEHTFDAQPGPIAVYPLWPDRFRTRRNIGIIWEGGRIRMSDKCFVTVWDLQKVELVKCKVTWFIYVS